MAITFTASSSSPLRGTKSGLLSKTAAVDQGKGISYPITIDPADQAKPLQLTFDYSTTSGYADGYVRVYVYDITNSLLIEGVQRDLAANANGTYAGSFQLASNCASARVIWHIADSTSTAWDLKIDNIFFGQKPVVKGAIVTDWISWTPTYSNFTAGNGVADFRMRRVGDSLEIRGSFTLGTTSSVTGAIRINMPTGYSIDASRVYDTTLTGNLLLRDSDTPANTVLGRTTITAASDRFQLSTTTSATTATSPFTWATGDSFHLENVVVPIVGWSSNVVLSEDTGNRVVAHGMNWDGTGTSTLAPNASAVLVNINNTIFDTTGANTPASSRMVITESGYYNVSGSVYVSSTNVLTDRYRLEIWKNGAVAGRGFDAVAASGIAFSRTATWLGYLVKGDYIDIRLNGNGNNSASTLTQTTTGTYLFANKIQTPQSIGQSEVVACSYSTDTAQSLTTATATTILFEDKSYDTHNAYNTATGVFTAPIGGMYSLDAFITLATNSGWAVGEFSYGGWVITGGGYNAASYQYPPTAGTAISVSPWCHHEVYIPKGGTATFQAYQTSGGSISTVASTERNKLTIKRIG